jgi:serine/threonine kinase 38
LNIPEESNLTPEARDVLKRFLCDADNRLGANGVQEIKEHPFFKGLDWENLRNTKSPFIPNVKDEEDCTRFDDFDEEEPFIPSDETPEQLSAKKSKKRKDINFPGYTFKKEVEEQKTKLVQALKGLLDSNEDNGEDDGNSSPPEQE